MISKDEILHVATLANLKLEPNEVDEFVSQLDKTVDGTANRSVRSVDMGLHARFNRSRTAIDAWHLVVFRLS